MNENREKNALRSRISRARDRQAFAGRFLFRGLTAAVLLAAAMGVGFWFGSRPSPESPTGPPPTDPSGASRPAATPAASTRQSALEPTSAGGSAPQPPRAGSAPVETTRDPAAADEGQPKRVRETASAQAIPEPRQTPAGRSESVTAAPAPTPAGAAPTEPTAAPVHTTASPPEPASGTASSDVSVRDEGAKQSQLEEALRRLEAILLSRTAGSSPYPEFDAALERIRLGRGRALEAHADGDIDSALRLLGGAEREADELVRNEEARFRLSLQAVEEAYVAGNVEEARMHVDQTLRQRPDDPEAKRWESRVGRLPELLAQRRNAHDARSAGNLRGELAALKRIVGLDPGDTSAGERARTIERDLREQAFARTIAQGRQAVADRALDSAKRALAEAQRRDPQHADTLALGTQVATLERMLIRDMRLAAAEQAAAHDDWEAALRAFEEARTIEPTHDGAIGGGTLAARMVKAQRAVDEFLARPERLGSAAVADAARAALRDAETLAALSPRLARTTDGLERAIEAARTPVPVTILSDERTEIGVRGVGTVGRVRERTIELVPGEYVFEGKRRGYRSKLVEVLVEAKSAAPVEVRVVCDERS